MKTNSNPYYNEIRQKCKFIVLITKAKFQDQNDFFLFCLDGNNWKIMVWGQGQDKSEILLHSGNVKIANMYACTQICIEYQLQA